MTSGTSRPNEFFNGSATRRLLRVVSFAGLVVATRSVRVSSLVMAYDEALADDIRAHLGDHPGLTEKQMFGGIAFMVGGNMAVGISGNELMVRVGKDAHDAAVSRPGARTFDMGARPMKGWVSVAPEGFASDADFASWIDQGVTFAESLPAK